VGSWVHKQCQAMCTGWGILSSAWLCWWCCAAWAAQRVGRKGLGQVSSTELSLLDFHKQLSGQGSTGDKQLSWQCVF
jgi:hypothetical protein